MKRSEATYLTLEGQKKLEEELNHLLTVKRAEVAERLHQAVEDGELLENAEYESAKNEQAFIEGRIMQLEKMLFNAIVIAHKTEDGIVQLGSRVVVQNQDLEPEEYVIVGAAEADPLEGRVSNESPFGIALLGKKAGERIRFNAPAGQLEFQILEVH
ncbi:MAG TPA: transcription elongation factor GreA [Anaerolineales bacterium]|nr:transcription elongation factor GreA [Anaerolineales bacterium]